MLRRLTFGLFILASAAVVAACSSSTTTPSSGGVPGIGPNFVKNTLYVTDTTQNAVEIYTPHPSSNATPQYAIGGNNTGLNGPQYAAFDKNKLLYVTNFNAGTHAAGISVYQTFATGNVLPFGSIAGAGTSISQPHGITMIPDNGGFVVANTATGSFFPSQVLVFGPFGGGTAALQDLIAGDKTQLHAPNGVALDSKKRVYVTNLGNSSITAYVIPSPSPTPSGSPSPTPSPTPSPSPTPTGSPKPTPTPTATPTPFSNNVAPFVTIAGPLTRMRAPTAVAIDANNNLYVADPDAGVNPAILIFSAASIKPGTNDVAPSRVISGSLTHLKDPTDVKLDDSGNIYVVDAGSGPNTSRLLIFAPTAKGNTPPKVSIALPPGSSTGMALSP